MSTQGLDAGGDAHPLHWARRMVTGKPGAKAVLYTLAVHADNDTLACWVLLRNIAKEADMKQPAAKNNLAHIAELGLVASIPLARRDNGQQTSSLYVLNIGGWLNKVGTWEEVIAKCEQRSARIKGEQARDVVPSKFRPAPWMDGLRLPSQRKG
jgi:hypothetical protein